MARGRAHGLADGGRRRSGSGQLLGAAAAAAQPGPAGATPNAPVPRLVPPNYPRSQRFDSANVITAGAADRILATAHFAIRRFSEPPPRRVAQRSLAALDGGHRASPPT